MADLPPEETYNQSLQVAAGKGLMTCSNNIATAVVAVHFIMEQLGIFTAMVLVDSCGL